jgi:hypothetical protein
MRRRELNGASVCTGYGCLQHTLGMWVEATTRVEETIPEIRTLLRSQPEDTTRWLTTSQMGWALTREENEIINEKDEREGKPVARQLAPMISTFIRAQWESGELDDVDDERRQILEEAEELDHIWGVWEVENEPTNVPCKWIRQPSQSGNYMRHHVEVHASHREKEWESPSASLIEKDPEKDQWSLKKDP